MSAAESGAWRALHPQALALEYSPSSVIDCLDDELAAYAARSAAARRAHPPRSHRYGPGPREELDLFRPAGVDRPPLVAFIHGGYWQELDKESASFLAPPLLSRGIAYVAIGYPLAPQASLEQIVDATARALRWLTEHADAVGVDATRLHLAGSSAGAHLAATHLLAGRVPLASATLLSGVYDLRPLVHTYVNDPLHLDEERAWWCSPLRSVQRPGPVPVTVAWGEIETAEFKRQSRDFADRLAAAGGRVRVGEVPGRNHFDVVFALTDPATELGRALFAAVEGGHA